MSLNLHDIVRNAITVNKSDAPFTVYRSVGQVNVDGMIKAEYIEVPGYTGQWQSEGDSALYHAELVLSQPSSESFIYTLQRTNPHEYGQSIVRIRAQATM